MNSLKKANITYFVLVSFLIISAVFSVYLIRHWGIIGYTIFDLQPTTEQLNDPSIVLYLSFDDPDDPWRDYSIYNHQFTANGDVNVLDKSYCKWYGCADFTVEDGSDYLNSSTKFKLDDGIAISFWVYYTTTPSSASSSSELGMGHSNNGNRKHIQTTSYGRSIELYSENGVASAGTGQSNRDNGNEWIHYFLQYDKNNIYIWKNSELLVNSSQPYGNLNYSVGELLYIGRIAPWGTTNLKGYLDEFVLWNRSNFTSSDVERFYNNIKLGTPPDLDIYVKSVKYELPYDWDDPENKLITGTQMDINFTIANAGIHDSTNFDYNLILEGIEVCSGSINIQANSEVNITCPWQTSYGFHSGFINIDLSNSQSEDVETNNNQRIYIPFLDRPWFHFNLQEWENDLKPYCQDPNNKVANSICSWLDHFGCSGWAGWTTGNSVDAYGKKAMECVMGCMYNDWTNDPNKNFCGNAYDHVMNWASLPVESYNNVQAIHGLAYVGMAVDTYFPKLTKQEWETISKQYHDICQQITNLPNTRPDKDDKDLINGGNGWGFGSGMAALCYSMLGAYIDNPTLIQTNDQKYWGNSIADEWMSREDSYLSARKNDSWTQYQEGSQYKSYSEPHILSNLWFRKKHDLIDVSQYNNALCSMARESIYLTLDFNYNGEQLRNDRNTILRKIQRGDSFSYQDRSDGQFEGEDILLFEGLLCDDVNTKSTSLWMRDKEYDEGVATTSYPAAYIYKLLRNQAEPIAPENVMPGFIYDNANDIALIRDGYTFSNDTIIQVDGGEERGSGHSQAQGYYLYALGEPFLDYEQVPYQDDVRAETWKNGISLQNATQTTEGTSGTYSATCGNAELNQYYGMQDCPAASFSTDYPNYRRFPLEYGGDLEDYIGTQDANFAGVYVWRPYKNADPIREYFVKFGNLLAKRTVISNNQQGEIFHNFINIYDEFTETRNGNDLTFKRTRWDNEVVYLDINVIHTTKPLTLGGGLTDVNYCFGKTSCDGSRRGNGKYRRTYLYAAEQDIDFILAHHWYYEGEKQDILSIENTDKGLNQEGNIIIFDTNNDGSITYQNKEVTGWALAYNDDEIAAFNTTLIKDNNVILLQSDKPFSAHLKRSSEKLILTANTMERDLFIDVPKVVRVTIDAQELSLNTNFIVTKNDEENISIISQSGTSLTFDIITGQNSDYYTIIGTEVDTTPNTPPTQEESSLGGGSVSIPTKNETTPVKPATKDETTKQIEVPIDPDQESVEFQNQQKPNIKEKITNALTGLVIADTGEFKLSEESIIIIISVVLIVTMFILINFNSKQNQ